jgi:type I restriction enzyme R subunit
MHPIIVLSWVMFKYEVIAFLQETQPKAWEKTIAVHGADADNRIIGLTT